MNEHRPTYIITRGELDRITFAAELVAASLFASIVFTFAFNGHWWLTGFRTQQFALLVIAITVIPAVLIANLAIVRHRILSRARRASHDIEIYALTESINLAVRALTKNVASIWLWCANATLVFIGFEVAIASLRFVRTPMIEYLGSHRPGPLDGLFYVGFILFIVYVLTEELLRRRRVQSAA